jgi:meiotic recombination protein SPO11
MDDEDFEDLFAEDDMLVDSSQESLTTAAANLVFDNWPKNIVNDSPPTPVTSANSQESVEFPGESRAADDTQSRSSFQCQESSTVVEQIESVFEQITDGLINGDNKLTIELKTRPTSTTQGGHPPSPASAKIKAISFPGRTAAEAWRFSTNTCRLDT